MSHCFREIRYGDGRIYKDDADDSQTLTYVKLRAIDASTRLDAEVEYAQDGVTRKYTKYTLTLETIIYPPTSHPYAESPVGSGDWNIEEEMERVRRILMTPGLKLGIYPAGVGEVPGINLTDQDATDALNTATPPLNLRYYEPDAIGGPFPQACTVYPIGSNQAIGLKWIVEFHATGCRLSLPPGVLDYSYESDFQVDPEGDLIFTLNGVYHFTRPITDVDIVDLRNILDPNFPPPPTGPEPIDYIYEGMHLDSKITRSDDGRTLTITHKHTPIKSANAYFPATHDITGSDRLSSELKDGFYVWTRSFNFEFNLRNRVPKNFAYQAFLRIVQNRMKNFTLYKTKKDVKDGVDQTDIEDQGLDDRQKSESHYIPTHIEVIDEPYSRRMRFRTRYMMFASLDRIMNISRIFERIPNAWIKEGYTNQDREEPDYLTGTPDGPPSETAGPAPLSDQWRQWALNTRYIENGYNQLSTTSPAGEASLPIVVDVCGNNASKPLLHFLRRVDSYDITDPVYDPCYDPEVSGSIRPPSESTDPIVRYNVRELGQDLDPLKHFTKYSCDPTLSDQRVAVNIGGETYYPPFEYSPETAFSWLAYNNSFSIVEDTSSLVLKFLDNVQMNYYGKPNQYVKRQPLELSPGQWNWLVETGPNNPFHRRYDGLTMNDRVRWDGREEVEDTGVSSWKPMRTVSRGQSRFYVRMQGRALRWQYDIPVPTIISIGNKIAYRVGTPVVSYAQLTASDMPINMVTWDTLYTIDGEPYHPNIAASITTNGVPSRYT